jgi:hypothetical protein
VQLRAVLAAEQVARQLSDPRPRDIEVTRQLEHYKGLAMRWQRWDTVTTVLAEVAEATLA